MAEKLEAMKASAKEGLRWFYNPVNQPVNAYTVFWVVITLLAFGIVAVSLGAIVISDNATLLKAIAGMAGVIALLSVLGILFRVAYKEDWENLTKWSAPTVNTGYAEPISAEKAAAALGKPPALGPPPALTAPPALPVPPASGAS